MLSEVLLGLGELVEMVEKKASKSVRKKVEEKSKSASVVEKKSDSVRDSKGKEKSGGENSGVKAKAVGGKVASEESKVVKEDKKDGSSKEKRDKVEKVVKKRVKQESRRVVVERPVEVVRRRSLRFGLAKTPTFRGRFGKRSIRRKSKEKWDKWRVPRGIDVKRVASDGFVPSIGYSKPRELRHVHPSGFNEVLVRSVRELDFLSKGVAVRVSSGIGRRKKLVIVDKAIERGLKVLNP